MSQVSEQTLIVVPEDVFDDALENSGRYEEEITIGRFVTEKAYVEASGNLVGLVVENQQAGSAEYYLPIVRENIV